MYYQGEKRKWNNGASRHLHYHSHGKANAVRIFDPEGKQAQSFKKKKLKQGGQHQREEEKEKMSQACRKYQIIPEDEENAKITQKAQHKEKGFTTQVADKPDRIWTDRFDKQGQEGPVLDALAGLRVFRGGQDKGVDQSASQKIGDHLFYRISADKVATSAPVNR